MSTLDYVHVLPLEDLREHKPACTCWCRPTEDDETPGLWVHHSLDQRELYENGELKLQ